MVEASKPIAIICGACESRDVSRDAWAEWDIATQEWVLRAVFDCGYCHACDEEARLAEQPLASTLE